VLKNFSSIRNLRMELPVSDVGTDDGVLLKWKAVFGSTLQTCVILGGTKLDHAHAGPHPPPPPTTAPDHDASLSQQGDGSIPESFYTNGGLKLRVVWTISSLIAAATRRYNSSARSSRSTPPWSASSSRPGHVRSAWSGRSSRSSPTSR
jgi:hypothetical protein